MNEIIEENKVRKQCAQPKLELVELNKVRTTSAIRLVCLALVLAAGR